MTQIEASLCASQSLANGRHNCGHSIHQDHPIHPTGPVGPRNELMAKKPESATPTPTPPGDTPINQELLAATEARILGALGETPSGMESMEAPVPAAQAVGSAKERAAKRLRSNPPAAVAARLRKMGIGPMPLEGFEALVAPATAVPPNPLEAFSPADIANGLERIIGRNELLGIQYLDGGQFVARAVGRVLVRGGSAGLIPMGTGFMIGPRLMMTNNHVLGSAQAATGGVLEFNFQNDRDGTPRAPVRFALDPATFFATSPVTALDFTIVALQETGPNGERLTDFGYTPLVAIDHEVLDGESVTIIQHPNGEPKQIALRENFVLKLPDAQTQFLHYQTDTTPGSSGSPVYNDEWEVVALHHSGVPRKDAQGRVLTPEGEVWKKSMGEHRIDWIANEGIRVAAIVAELKARTDLGDGMRQLLAVTFAPAASTESRQGRPDTPTRPPASPPPPPQPRLQTPTAVAQPPRAPLTMSLAGNAATWTVPLQVTVSFGIPTLQGAAGPGIPVARQAPTATDPAVAEALAELEAGAARPYYDSAADQQARTNYYQAIPANLTPAAMFQAVGGLLRSTHQNRPAYKPTKHLYPWVDLRPNRKIQSIYSGLQFEPLELIQMDLAVDRAREEGLARFAATEAAATPAALEALESALEAAFPYNCEHVVPQSWFNKKESMRGDLHHLFACETNCNSFRGNTPYFDFPDFGEAVRSDCGKREGNRFEPGAGKGMVARATLYFLLRYPGEINSTGAGYTPDRLNTLLGWHTAEPPAEYERHRNQAIFEKQGNRNPLIDHPEWASHIDFRLGLG